jgi:predicted HTH domain antitoxin
MQTVTMSMRLPKAEAEKLAQVARETGVDRSTLLKRAVRRGTRDLLFDEACRAYRADEATLSRAAEIAGLGLRDMILRLRAADLELNYAVEDLEKDLQP